MGYCGCVVHCLIKFGLLTSANNADVNCVPRSVSLSTPIIQKKMTSRKQVLSEEVLSNHIVKGYRSGITKEDRNKEYDGFAAKFGESSAVRRFVAPWMAAEKVAKYILPTNRCTAVVLDIDAGTGLVGEQLQRLGFITTDALEPSRGMITNTEKKNVNRNFICESISQKPLEIH